MIGPLSGSSPLQDQQTAFYCPFFSEMQDYFKIKGETDALNYVLLAAKGAPTLRKESFADWLDGRKVDGHYLGSGGQAQARLEDTKAELQEEITDTRATLHNLQGELAEWKGSDTKEASPLEAERGNMLEQEIKNLKSSLHQTETALALLSHLKVMQAGSSNAFTIEGPANWEKLLKSLAI